MANDKAAPLTDSGINNTSNTQITKSETTSGVPVSSMINNFHSDNRSNNATGFKALDFSDTAIYGKGSSQDEANHDEKFRHFHQMRIFIQRGNTVKHGGASSEQTMIVCNLPERIQYALKSKWGNPIKFGDENLFNLMMQVGAEKIVGKNAAPSGTLRASTLRIWQNTEPLSLNLSIPVIDDGKDVSGTNLVEALEILGSLVLPRKNSGFFYTPPPSPLSININYTSMDPRNPVSEKKDPFNLNTQNYARIMVQLGGVLLIDNCIIEEVSVDYPNTKAQIKHKYQQETFGNTGGEYLHPLLAVVNIRISTLEALTANTYSRMLWARDQSNEGHYNRDLSDLTTGIHDALRYLYTFGDNNNEQQPPQPKR